MRRTLILTLAVLSCALAVCWGSRGTLNATVDEARLLHDQALLAENSGDSGRTVELLVRLADFYQESIDYLLRQTNHPKRHR